MGGDIWFESKPGVGSTFHFKVTFGRSERERERDICPVTDTIRPLNILLAEDNAFNQRVIADTLKMNGHQVTVAGNGKEAIALWEKGAYNLVLMDVQMPEMSGLEATEEIRRREAGRGGHTVIIAISANAMKEDREKCLQAGMDDYISKPVDMKELFGILQQCSADPLWSDKGVRPMAGNEPPRHTPGVFGSGKPGADKKTGETGDVHSLSDGTIAGLFNLNSMPGLKNNRQALEQYARSFMKDMNGEMDAMERAIREGDHEQIGKSAHTVKGMSGHLKSDQITRIASEIERMVMENDLKAVAEGFLELKTYFAAVGKMPGI